MIARPASSQQRATPAFESRSLVDFFNHGTLPFIGREPEVERLIAFWRGTAESQGLRGALVLGEAGVGKSRLVEEVIPRIVRQGGVVIHAKLYPGSSTSIVPLLARAIRFSGTSRQLLKKEPEETIESVIGALERLSRLRPLLLVLEDIHLLGGEALGEFAMLLDALSSESISFLALARPIELTALGVIERYLVEEVILEGLGEEAMKGVWNELFQAPVDPKLLNLLLKTTHGNALALRSALRGVLKSGALTRGSGGVWGSTLPLPQFNEALERNIQLLSEGMAAHLSPEEKRAAERFASLGEVFARETALALSEDAEKTIDILLFKGMLVHASTSIFPLPGAASSGYPIAFTHSLLHKHFVQSGTADVVRLIDIIDRDLPLYSIVPFQILAQHTGAIDTPTEKLRSAIERALRITIDLDESADWLLGRDTLAMAEKVFATHADLWPEYERRELNARIITTKLNMLRRVEFTAEFNEGVERLFALSEEPAPDSLLEYRLQALRYRLTRVWRNDFTQWDTIWNEVEDLLDRYPRLLHTRGYISYLQEAASSAAAIPDNSKLRRCEERLHTILSSHETSPELRRFAYERVSVHFLEMFDTEEELLERLKLMNDLEASLGRHDMRFQMQRIPLLLTIGATEELRQVLDAVIGWMKERGMNRLYFQYRLIRACEKAPFGVPLDDLATQARELIATALPQIVPRLKLSAGVRLTHIGLFRGDLAWTRSMIQEHLGDEEPLAPHGRIVLARAEGWIDDLLRWVVDENPPYLYIVLFARIIIGGTDEDRKAAEEETRQTLATLFLCREDLLTIYSLLDLLELARMKKENVAMVDSLLPEIRNVLKRTLEWLALRSFFAFMRPLLDRSQAYLEQEELERWRGLTDEIAARFEGAKEKPARDGLIKVTMLGKIEVTYPGQEPIRLRGARLRMVLGLLVADRMLEKPLTYREFCRLAAGGEDDPERARKMVSMAILRLRESAGDEIIDTSGEAPQLDLTRVQVDLLDAQQFLREATDAARHGSLMRALPLLIEAFNLIGAEVAFPSLYDEIFEAIREDFEFQLREAVIAVGDGLLREGDAASAEEALRRGFEAMPEDEEIAAKLCAALEQQGKKVEAERIRIKVEEEL